MTYKAPHNSRDHWSQPVTTMVSEASVGWPPVHRMLGNNQTDE